MKHPIKVKQACMLISKDREQRNKSNMIFKQTHNKDRIHVESRSEIPMKAKQEYVYVVFKDFK